jgi:hypothetical protein
MVRPAPHVIKRFPDHELAIDVWPTAARPSGRCATTTPSVLRLSGDGSTRPTQKRAVSIAELRDSLAELETEIRQTLEEAARRSG